MADQNGSLEIQRSDQGREVLSESIIIVALPRLAGSAVAAAVEGDATKATRSHEHHLVVPDIGVERPAVAEDDGRSLAPILVKNFGAVFCRDGAHPANSSAGMRDPQACICSAGGNCGVGQQCQRGSRNYCDQNVATRGGSVVGAAIVLVRHAKPPANRRGSALRCRWAAHMIEKEVLEFWKEGAPWIAWKQCPSSLL